MGEIMEEEPMNNNINSSRSAQSIENKKVEIILKTIGPTRPTRLSLPSSIKVRDLKEKIAGDRHIPVESLKLIWQGNVLHDTKHGNDVVLQLKNDDSLIVAVKPKPPVKHLRNGIDDDDEDETSMFQLPQSAGWCEKRLYYFLHDKLKLPDVVLMAVLSLSLKAWVLIILWFIMAPVAHRWELGPLYILGTGFTIILLNLGRRQPGEMSAYSVFNEDFRELPGTLNADRLDRDIRAGQF